MQKNLSISLAILLSITAGSVLAQSIKINLLQSETVLEYVSAPRLSQVITEAAEQTDYAIYPLGVTLISPDKQALIDEKKRSIFTILEGLKNQQAAQILKHLKKLHFVHKEPSNTLLRRIRTDKKLNPLLSKNYTLSLPIRPDYIRLITPMRESTSLVKYLPNTSLKEYLTKKVAGDSYDSAWIIQANQDTRLVSNIQWQSKKYYLSPGAIVFVGLSNLPSKYQTLNQDIAELLSQHLEL